MDYESIQFCITFLFNFYCQFFFLSLLSMSDLVFCQLLFAYDHNKFNRFDGIFHCILYVICIEKIHLRNINIWLETLKQ